MIGSHDTENRLKTAPASKVHTTQARKVQQYTLEGKPLKTFESLAAAARYLQKTGIAPTAAATNINKAARGYNFSAYNHRWSYEGEPLHKTAVKKRGAPRRAVEMYNLEGKHLMSFESLTAAAQYLQKTGIAPKATARNIRAAARGKLYSAYGHRWSFTGEPLANATAKNRGLQRRAVEMITLEGKHLKTFESGAAAAQYLQKTGIAPKAAATNIRAAAQGKRYSAHGYKWRYKGQPTPKVTPKQSGAQPRAVDMYTLEGEHLKTFESCAAAAQYLHEKGIAPKATAGNISRAARGKTNSAHGYKWRYKGQPTPKVTPKTPPKKSSSQPRGIEMFTLAGEHLMSFESLAAAAQYLQKTGIAPKAAATNIRVAAQGKLYSAYDRRWSYEGEPLPNTTAKNAGPRRQRAVEMLTLASELLMSFESCAAAARYLQKTGKAPTAAATGISKAARGKRYSAYGYKWRYEGEPLPNTTPKKRGAPRRGVEMYTLEGERLMSFESCAAAARYLQKTGKAPTAAASSIRAAARGKQYSSYDRRWSYKVSSPLKSVGISR